MDLKTKFQDFYNLSKTHKDTHVEDGRKCGGEPYKSYLELFEIVKNFAEEKKKLHEKLINILEIGTAVGFTTFVLQEAILSPGLSGGLDTIEFYQTHIEEAKKNITQYGGDVSKISFYEGDALSIMPTLKNANYDIIFFDGYGVKQAMYTEFEKKIKKDCLLIVANRHLKSTEHTFFEQLASNKQWEFVVEFADTVVYKRLALPTEKM